MNNYETILLKGYTEKEILESKILPNNAIRWNRENEFIIERNSKIVSYGIN